LNLDLGPVIPLESAATLEDLFLESHLSSTMLTREEAEQQLAAFRGLSEDKRAAEVATQLAFLAQQGSVPCIVDKGALLDSEGRYFPEYAEVLRRFLTERGVYLSLVHIRSPTFRELPVRSQIFERRLRALLCRICRHCLRASFGSPISTQTPTRQRDLPRLPESIRRQLTISFRRSRIMELTSY